MPDRQSEYRFAVLRRRRKNGQGGQVLAFALIAMIAILIAVIFLFDLNTVIRGKVKGQNAVDAAALTGATWQMHTLNLIGELNLIKATSVLLSGTPFGIAETEGRVNRLGQFRPLEEYLKTDGSVNFSLLNEDIIRVEDEKQRLSDTVDLLTQLQTRVSFVLPLIGYGAAQQAAKNNGINWNPDGGEVMVDMLRNVYDVSLYGNADVVPQTINGYAWRIPYANMLETIIFSGNSPGALTAEGATGIAVGTSYEGLCNPFMSLKGAGSQFRHLLTMRTFYESVNANSWCDLRDILGADFTGNWWGDFDISYHSSFGNESEILPVHIDFYTGDLPYGNLDKTFPKRLDSQDSTTVPLNRLYDDADPYPYTYTVDDNGEATIDYQLHYDAAGHLIVNPDDTDLRANILPDFTWCTYGENWTGYDAETISFWSRYLRKSFRDGYAYFSGAVTWFQMRQETVTMTGNLSGTEDGGKRIGNAFNFKDKTAKNMMNSAETNLRSGVHQIVVDASAKPFGRIRTEENGKYLPPFEAGNMVLPVFTKVALIPVELEGHGGINQLDKDWIFYITKFLPILGESKTLDDAVTEFRQRHSGYGRIQYFINALRKVQDPEWHREGLAWLEAPARWRYELRTVYDAQTGKQVEKKVRIVTKQNKDLCDEWPNGNGNPGTRTGPGRLH